jgi:hypothetical protein
MERDMQEELKFGLKEHFMKDIGEMIKQMDR